MNKKADLDAKLRDHLEVAQSAQDHYRLPALTARAKYVAATAKWNDLRRLYAAGKVTKATIEEDADYFSQLIFIMESDYQQDKHLPHWGASPQPGPTYFMSHETAYVQIIVCPSLGEAKGDTRFGRNHMYTRSQCVGPEDRVSRSKDSNDTVSTVSHFLSGVPSTMYSPPIFRPGYDEDGPIRLQ